MAPLRAIESDLLAEAGPDIAQTEAERRIMEAELKKLESKAAGGCGASREAARNLAVDIYKLPINAAPKLLVDDATAEAIEKQLAAQGGRLVVAGCEGGLFDVMAGRYSSNGSGNLDCFLKGHAADDLRVDRVSRGSIYVERCCLTLAYAVQPEVIRGLADKPSFRGRGLIGRFWYAVPRTLLGRRSINSEPVSSLVTEDYERLVRRLAAITAGEFGPRLLTLDAGATGLFFHWQVEVESMLGGGGRLSSMTDWGGKLCGLTARLAAIMHLVVESESSEPWEVPVSESVMESAITLARWSIPHAEAVIDLMRGIAGPVEDAEHLLQWIRERGLTTFTRREAHTQGRRRFDGDPERLDAALKLLAEYEWINPILTLGQQRRAGRRPSQTFAVNPAATDRTQNPQNAIQPVGRVRGVI